MIKGRNDWPLRRRLFVSEFLGTAVLLLVGLSVVILMFGTGSPLARLLPNEALRRTITGFLFGTTGALIALSWVGKESGAHLNPAVTLGFAVRSGNFSKVGPYFAAQMLGAFVGAVLVWLHYSPHWRETPDPAAKLACFCTAPAIRNFAANLVSETIATFVLVFVVGAIFSRSVAASGPGAMGPYLVGSLVWGIGLSLGGTTGYAINPARDFGPRIAHGILPVAGKGGSDWSYGIIAIIGPLIGGALAGWLLAFLHIS
jgi:glycerol uptake facilitator protein